MKKLLRKVLYALIKLFSTVVKKDVEIVVLCYHSFSESSWRFSIKIRNFKKQMEYLQKNYKFITVYDLYAYIKGKEKISKNSVLLTIDDGYKDILKIEHFINNLGVKPLLFVLSSPDRIDAKELGTNQKLLTKKELLRFKKNGWIIGSHGATHTNFYNLSDKQIENEIRDSKRELEKKIKIKIEYFAYPKGRYNDRIIKKVEESGYKLGFSMDDEIITPKINRFKIPRIGVDGTHSFFEFTIIFTFWAIQVRKIIKKYFSNLALRLI